MISSIIKPQTEQVSFDVQTIYKGHLQVTYRGVRAIRSPFDYLIYQMILSEVRPDLVIEIGTNVGGGAYYLADLMELMQLGEVHTIDIEKKYDPVIESHPRIKIFMEGWAKYDFSNTEKFKNILVIDDASHQYKDTLDAITRFASLVTPGSYLIVEDGIVDELGLKKLHTGGPLKAIREFLKSHPEFKNDNRWTDFFGRNATFNVNGYLKKSV